MELDLTQFKDKDLEQFLPGFDFALNILLQLKGQCIHKIQVRISSYIAHYCTFLLVLKSREQSLLLSDTLPSSGQIWNCTFETLTQILIQGLDPSQFEKDIVTYAAHVL